MYPAVSAMAGFVEMFRMPMREIEQKFTRSELTLIAWRSQESNMSMKKRINKTRKPPLLPSTPNHNSSNDDLILEGLPEEFFNEEHEVDLSKVDSQHALKYFQSYGIYIPTIKPGSSSKPPSEVK